LPLQKHVFFEKISRATYFKRICFSLSQKEIVMPPGKQQFEGKEKLK